MPSISQSISSTPRFNISVRTIRKASSLQLSLQAVLEHSMQLLRLFESKVCRSWISLKYSNINNLSEKWFLSLKSKGHNLRWFYFILCPASANIYRNAIFCANGTGPFHLDSLGTDHQGIVVKSDICRIPGRPRRPSSLMPIVKLSSARPLTVPLSTAASHSPDHSWAAGDPTLSPRGSEAASKSRCNGWLHMQVGYNMSGWWSQRD